MGVTKGGVGDQKTAVVADSLGELLWATLLENVPPPTRGDRRRGLRDLGLDLGGLQASGKRGEGPVDGDVAEVVELTNRIFHCLPVFDVCFEKTTNQFVGLVERLWEAK